MQRKTQERFGGGGGGRLEGGWKQKAGGFAAVKPVAAGLSPASAQRSVEQTTLIIQNAATHQTTTAAPAAGTVRPSVRPAKNRVCLIQQEGRGPQRHMNVIPRISARPLGRTAELQTALQGNSSTCEHYVLQRATHSIGDESPCECRSNA